MDNKEKNFINEVVTMRAAREELIKQCERLTKAIDDKIMSFSIDNAIFKIGDTVQFITEKYKVPRKYIIKEVAFGVVSRENDGSYSYRRFYEISTINGHVPNGGWSVEEKYLKPYDLARDLQ